MQVRRLKGVSSEREAFISRSASQRSGLFGIMIESVYEGKQPEIEELSDDCFNHSKVYKTFSNLW